MGVFDRPIPGQSLTREPGNAHYERPPQITDPEEALMMHLTRLSDPDIMESALLLMDNGADVKGLTEATLRNAVMEGIHSIDVSLIIKKPIEEWLAGTAKEIGIDYKTGYEKADKSEQRKRHAVLKSAKSLTPADIKVSDKPEQVTQDKQTTEEAMPMPQQEAAPAPSKGLMARVQ